MSVITVVGILIGMVLGFGVSFLINKRHSLFYDGQMVLTTEEDGVKRFTLELKYAPEELEDKKVIVFKVVKMEVPEEDIPDEPSEDE